MATTSWMTRLTDSLAEKTGYSLWRAAREPHTLAEFGVESVFIELTNHCNMHCQFCPSDTLKRGKRFMDLRVFKRAIDQLVQLKPTNPISFHVLGEPLLHPQVLQCIDYCASKGLRVIIFSNGLATVRKIDELCRRDNIDALVLSLQTPTPESFKLRGVKVEFERYRQSILDVVGHVVRQQASQKMRVEIHLANTRDMPFPDWSITDENEAAIEAFRSLTRDLKRVERESLGEPCDEAEIERLTDEALRRLPPNLIELREWDYWGFDAIPNVFLRLKVFCSFGAYDTLLPPGVTVEERTEPTFCEGAKSFLCVLSDGTITQCCVDAEGETKIGRIQQFCGLYRALTSPERDALIRDVSHNPLCRRCKGTIKINRL